MNSTYSIQAHPPRLNDTFFPELSQFFGINQISSDRSETNSIDPQLSQMMEEDTLSPKATRSSTLLANMKKILEKVNPSLQTHKTFKFLTLIKPIPKIQTTFQFFK